MTDNTLTLSVFDDIFAICRFSPHEPIPEWAAVGPFCSMTRTSDELSIVCLEKHVPEGVDCERGWRALKLEGSFKFSLAGMLVSIVEALIEAGVHVFTIPNREADYTFVKESQLERALYILRNGFIG